MEYKLLHVMMLLGSVQHRVLLINSITETYRLCLFLQGVSPEPYC